MNRRALGRGLKALIPESSSMEGNVREIPLDQIDRNVDQPRQRFDEAELEELSQSIATHGVLEPVIVRPIQGRYELVVGERRWRAAQLAGLEGIPAIVRDLDDRSAMELALVENLQREDLNPIEEADAFRRLMIEFDLTQEEVAARVGKKRSTVANRLRLLELEDELKDAIQSGQLSAGHAKALLGVESSDQRLQLAWKAIDEGLSVRAVEELARGDGVEQPKKAKRSSGRLRSTIDPLLQDVEERLRHSLGTKVRVVGKGERGKIEIEYYSEDEMQRIIEFLAGQGD